MSNETDSKLEAAARDEKPKLKVIDRRMFDSEGNPRLPDGDSTEVPSEAPSPPDAAAVEEASETTPTPVAALPTEDLSQTAAAEDSVTAPASEDSGPFSAGEDAGPAASDVDSSPGPAGENDPDPGGSYADLPRGFAPFVESQYLEALIFLGAVPHPQTGETMEDPEFARYKIDLLTMIQEKTAGNLTSEESRLMEDVLYQLRLLFVEKTNPGGKP